MYDSNLKSRWDYENSIVFAREEAAEKARHEEALNIAKVMKEDGISTSQIVKFTKLSIEEIEKL
jgi:predicted transposase YdaD